MLPLATLLRQQAVVQRGSSTATVQAICRLINVLVLVRGHKTVVKFFPHEAADLERVLSVLQQVKASSAQPGAAAAEDTAVWEAQSVLLLWLSILIIIPFDLSTVDSAAGGAGSRCGGRAGRRLQRAVMGCGGCSPAAGAGATGADAHWQSARGGRHRGRRSLAVCLAAGRAGRSATRRWWARCWRCARSTCTTRVSCAPPRRGLTPASSATLSAAEAAAECRRLPRPPRRLGARHGGPAAGPHADQARHGPRAGRLPHLGGRHAARCRRRRGAVPGAGHPQGAGHHLQAGPQVGSGPGAWGWRSGGARLAGRRWRRRGRPGRPLRSRCHGCRAYTP